MKKLPNEVLEATLNYLAEHKFKEVAGLINALSNLEDIKPIKDIKTKPKTDGGNNS